MCKRQAMRNWIVLLISLNLISCSSGKFQPEPILDAAFPYEENEDIFPQIKYQVGFIGNKRGYYGFQIDNNDLLIALKDFDTLVISKDYLKIDTCLGLKEEINKIKPSSLLSSEMILGYKPVQQTNVIMLDGLSYELYLEGNGSSSITLSGFGIAELEIPWIKIAENIKTKALACIAHNKPLKQD